MLSYWNQFNWPQDGYNLLVCLSRLQVTLTPVFQRPYRIHHYNISAYSLSDKVFINASISNIGKRVSLPRSEEWDSTAVHPIWNLRGFWQWIDRFKVYKRNGWHGLSLLRRFLIFLKCRIRAKLIFQCRLFRNRAYMPFVQILYRILSDQGNYPTSCPVKRVSLVHSL